MRRCLFVCTVLSAFVASAASAQTVCDIIEVPGSNTNYANPGTAQETLIITGGANLRCSGGRVIQANQATRVAASGRIELFGNVRVEDPQRTMTAERATFFSANRLMTANGSVVVRDRETGSVIRGDNVNYYQETPQRPQARLEATAYQGLARAVLFRRGAAGAERDSTIVDAAQINLVGEQTFTAMGGAVMIRDSMRASGFSIEYRQDTGDLVITRDGRVTLPDQVLRGDSINATLGDDDELRSVLTRHGAALEAEEMQVRAPAIRLLFEEGAVVRMVAMNWPAAAGGLPGARPRVEAEEFVLDADSIDVLAPEQQITEAVAIGSAFGQRITPDSLRALMPDLSDMPEARAALFRDDWMRGDTVRAVFAANPDRETDPDAPERTIEKLVAVGQPATSVYRMRDGEDPAAKLSISYLTAGRIAVTFANGTVSLVEAEGDAKGIYVQPAPPPRQQAGRRGGQ